MARIKYLLLALVLCFLMVVSVLCGCNTVLSENDNTNNGVSNENDIIPSIKESSYTLTIENIDVIRTFGTYKGYDIVLAQSDAISNTNRQDTINGINFKYSGKTQLLAIKSNNICTLKEAYLDIIVDSSILREIKTVYDQTFKAVDGEEYTEIGDEIVLQKKEIWDEHISNIHDDWFVVTIDINFYKHYFDGSEFSMIDIKHFDEGDRERFERERELSPNLNKSFILILNNPGKDNILNAIRTLEQLDYVVKAYPRLVWFD